MTPDISSILQSIDDKMATQVRLLKDMKDLEAETLRDRMRMHAISAVSSAGRILKSGLSGAGDALAGAGKAAEGAGGGIGSILSGLGGMIGKGGLGLAAILVAGGMIDAQAIKDNVLTLLSIPDEAGGKLEMLLDGGTIGAALWGLGMALQPFAIGGAMNAAVSYFAGQGGVEDWAHTVKDNVLTLLSIADGVSGNISLLFKGASVGTALLGLGAGLIAFGTGSALTGLGQWITDTDWAHQVKDNVTTLLSIADGLGANAELLLEGAVFTGAMTGLGVGLAALSVGQAAAGLAQFVTDDDWAQRVKDSVATLLSISELPGIGWDTATFVATMAGLATGLTAFALGKGANVVVDGADEALAYFADEEDFADRIKSQVETLLSISSLPGVGADTGMFVATMSGLALGLTAFALGKGLDTTVEGVDKALAYFTGEDDFAGRIKNQVMTLLSIPGLAPEGSVESFIGVMGSLAAGLLAFSTSNFVGTLENAGSAIISFFTGVESPFEQIRLIASDADNLMKAADAMDKIASALERFGSINVAVGEIDFAKLAENLSEAIPLLYHLANGGVYDPWGLGNKIDFGEKGILDPALRLDEMADAIAKVNYVLGQTTTYPVNIEPTASIGARTGIIENAAIAGTTGPAGSPVYAPTSVNTGGNVTNAPTTYNTVINPHTGLDSPPYLLGGR